MSAVQSLKTIFSVWQIWENTLICIILLPKFLPKFVLLGLQPTVHINMTKTVLQTGSTEFEKRECLKLDGKGIM